MLKSVTVLPQGGQQSFDMLIAMPNPLAGPEDWDFQGVDTAFLDNLCGYYVDATVERSYREDY